jgi:hypothetical protein
MGMPERRLQDLIENLVVKALASDDPPELDRIIEQLREALHEHLRRKKRPAA